MTSKLTRERLAKIKSWRETYGAGSNVMLPAEDAEELARIALAAMDSEPDRNPVLAYADSYRDMAKQGVWSVPIWSVITDLERNIAPLYRHAQPVPVVSADLLHSAASAIEDLLTTKDRTGAGVWFDLPFRLRSAANAQPAPVVPDDVLAALQKVARIRLDMNDFDGDRRGIADCLGDAEEALIEVVNRRAAILAAAPQSPGSEPATVPGKWIPVSERMPEDEQEVLTINKMGHRFVSFFDKHSGLFFDRLDAPAACCIERVLVTHWMPLPAAPQEVKSES